MMSFLKRFAVMLVVSAAASLSSQQAQATHLVGSDISYTSLGGNVYRIELTFYRDCLGSPAPLGVGIEFNSVSCGQYFTDTLLRVSGTGNEITFPCPTQATSCTDPNSTLPGIQEYKYSGIVTLPARCVDWVISWSYCCRNCDLTTMVVAQPCVTGANPGMYVAATLNNLYYDDNNAPTFVNNPIAFVCLGQEFTYNHGVVDPDGDSLVYTLVNPLQNSTDSVPFVSGYSATNPITSSPALTLDPSSGDINMTPTQQEVGIMSVLVEEYRDGLLVGSVIRDMAVYVRPCNNILPTASGINGSEIRDTSICPGTNLCFNINTSDVDSGQVLSLQWNQGIPGATFTVAGSPDPVGTFCWTPTSADVGTLPHTFTVTVFDNACPNSGYQSYAFNIYVNSPTFTLQSTDISCNGLTDGVANVVAGSPTLTYLWSPGGETTSSISGLSAGTYSVVISDTANGCTATQQVTISEPDPLAASVVTEDALCSGVNSGLAVATATGGTPGYTYSWDTTPTTQNDTASNLGAGTYTVTVTDSRGCTTTSGCTINSNGSPIVISVDTVSTLLCNGDQNGYASVSVSSGTTAFTYSWYALPDTFNVISSTFEVTNIGAGFYLVEVEDTNGCVSSETIQVNAPTPLIAVGSSNPANCSASNGFATAIVSGGVGGYTYSWNPGGATTDTLFNVQSGAYDVTITDENGCTVNAQVPVSDIELPTPLVTSTPVLCNGSTDGTATVIPQGTTGPFTLLWNTNPAQTVDSVYNLAPGTYTVGVTDTNGCQAFNIVIITEPDPITAIISSTDVLCFGGNDGSASVVSATGGSGSYTYTWSPSGGSNATASNLSAGSYSVTITDQNNCSASFTNIIIQDATAITVAVNSTVQPTCYGGSDGSIDISASGGTGGLSYFWNPGGAVSPDLSNIDAGIYVITVTDANGCSTTQSVPLGQPSPVTANAGSDQIVCSGFSTQMDAVLNSGETGVWTVTSSSQVQLVDPSNPITQVNNLSSGQNDFVWTVTDANGCVGSAQLSIFNYGDVVATAGTDTFFCGLSDLLLNASSVAGFGGEWSSTNGATFSNQFDPNATASFSVYGPDTLRWTISNVFCSTSAYLVADPRECGLDLPTAFSPNGDGKNDGFEIKGVWQYPDNIFRVFNRWGNEVYYKEDYVNCDWVGQNNKGEPLPDGTYFVIFQVVGQDLQRNTFVDLRR